MQIEPHIIFNAQRAQKERKRHGAQISLCVCVCIYTCMHVPVCLCASFYWRKKRINVPLSPCPA